MDDLVIERTTPVEISVLGELRVRVDGVECVIAGGKQRELVARLVVDAGRVVAPDHLIDALWGEVVPVTVTKNLHVLVNRLRMVVGSDVIVSMPSGYLLDADKCTIDAVEHQRHVADGQQLANDGRHNDAIHSMSQAIGLWRGSPAAECGAPWGAPSAARWLESNVLSRELLLAMRSTGSPGSDVLDDLQALIEQHPHRESLRVLLVDTLRRRGDLSGAHEALREAINVLRQDLGLSPGAELEQRVVEFGVAGLCIDECRATSHLVDGLGDRFQVSEVLASARDAGANHIALLDELESLVARGELVRIIDGDGRVFLARPDSPGYRRDEQ